MAAWPTCKRSLTTHRLTLRPTWKRLGRKPCSTNPAKLNDQHQLVQPWPSTFSKAGIAALRARGRGIDAVWRTGGKTGKPYAVVEAKASCNPTRQLKDLLGDAADKEGADGQGDSSARRGRRQQGRSGSAANTGGLSLPEKPQRQTDGRVTQMSNSWIRKRLQKAIGGGESFRNEIVQDGYTRHVLFFSIPQAAGHAMALSRWVAGQKPTTDTHKAHEATREWRDAEIDKVVDHRAGLDGKQRDHRNFSKIG